MNNHKELLKSVLLVSLIFVSLLNLVCLWSCPSDPFDKLLMVDGVTASFRLTYSRMAEVQEVEEVAISVDMEEPQLKIEETEELIIALSGKDLYISYIDEICSVYYPDLDPAIVKAVVDAESNWQPDVQSKCGAVGLMQVIPKYHSWRAEQYGFHDIWDPYANILSGADFLNELYESRGDYYHALLGYNNSSSYANYVISLSDNYR